jgi:3-oxoacyl-[acyl-carrier-protein] synthase-3
MKHAAIIGVGSYLPERRLTNADLERMVDTSDEWILSRTGISERRIVAEGQATSDMAAEAGSRALASAGADPGKVDLLIVATSTPDTCMPSAAALAQAKMGLTCPAIDVNAACTGFIYALQLGTSAIESGRARKVLVIGADTLSSIVDFTDRTTCILFGDGAGAVLLRASKEPGMLGIHLGADGNSAKMLEVRAGGSAAPCTPERLAAREQFVVMNGNEIFKFAVRRIPQVTKQALRESHLTIEDIDWLVPHQANQRITNTIAERLGIPGEHVVSTIRETGNTSAASIPLALDALYTGGRLRPGQTLALVGFGAGLTWGAAIVRWTKEEDV